MEKDYKRVIRFLAKFFLAYFVLYGLYFGWVKWAYPQTILLTDLVAYQTSGLLNLLGEQVSLHFDNFNASIEIIHDGQAIISVFQGCNAGTLYVVFLSFMFSFFRINMKILLSILLGLVILNFSNVIRVAGLYYIGMHQPGSLFFYHKYVFTILLFIEVIGLWYFATKKMAYARH